MEPFYFGPAQRRLFGIYHPSSDIMANQAVVICPPLFAEFMRSHSCLRRLSHRLASAGSHVLRFDYYGTGDSAGEFSSTTADDWVTDIGTAMHELREIAGVESVRLIGVRLGATLAARALARFEGADRLTMWDPVVEGAVYLRQLEDSHQRLTGYHRSTRDPEDGSFAELVGFPVSGRMLETLRHLALPLRCEITKRRDVAISIVAAKGNGDALARYARQEGIPLVEVDFQCDWMNHSDVVLHPHEIIDILSAER